jgi:hypothetical protein
VEFASEEVAAALSKLRTELMESQATPRAAKSQGRQRLPSGPLGLAIPSHPLPMETA